MVFIIFYYKGTKHIRNPKLNTGMEAITLGVITKGRKNIEITGTARLSRLRK